MSDTKPSLEVYSVDVPEPDAFAARFVYNFHVPAEGVDEASGLTKFFATKPGEYYDAKVVDTLGTRIPRYVALEWKPVSMRDAAVGVTLRDDLPRNYIRDNLSRLISEEYFSSTSYTSVAVTDQEIERKLEAYAASYELLAMEQSSRAVQGLRLPSTSKLPKNPNLTISKQLAKVRSTSRVKDFNFHVQIANSVVGTVMARAIGYPESSFQESYRELYEISQRVQASDMTGVKDFDPNDYVPVSTEYVSLMRAENASRSSTVFARIVGYVVDKLEMTKDGSFRYVEPIVVENPNASSTIDPRVKYYGKYRYQVRSVAEVNVPCLVEDTSEFAVARFLVASRPTVVREISCVENIPPPPPVDLKFVWDWTREKLVVSWSFPTNSQRDVKRFQVFRRRDVQEPFSLVKQYDFDDSVVPAPYYERPEPKLVELLASPKTTWTDETFDRHSAYIYTLGSVDAHGMVSPYGVQMYVSFDRYANRLVVRQVSSSGAPRPYPNMNLAAETFLDSVYEARKTKVHVSFDADCAELVSTEGTDLEFVKYAQSGGSYKILALNTDLAESETVEILVDDRRSAREAAKPYTSLPIVPDYGSKGARNAM